MEMLTILGILGAQCLGVVSKQYIDNNKMGRERKERREKLLHKLIACRNNFMHTGYAEAFNMIYSEYHNCKKAKKIIEARPSLQELFNNYRLYAGNYKVWLEQYNELYDVLLHEMSKFLGYPFKKGELEKNFYSPQGRIDASYQQTAIQHYFEEVSTGQKELPRIIKEANGKEASP